MDFLGEDKVRKARKVHCCDLCGRSIQPGERYVSTFNVYDGYAFNFNRHILCDKTMDAMYTKPDDGWTQEYFKDNLHNELCDYIAEIARELVHQYPDANLHTVIDNLYDILVPTNYDIDALCRMLCTFKEFDDIKNENF